MSPKDYGIDIVTEIGGINTYEAATGLFEKKMDAENLSKIRHIKNKEINIRIANAIAMCDPEKIFVNTGSEADKQTIRDLSIEKGEEAQLPMDKHTIHYDLKDEQGRIIDRTYYIVDEGETISSLANKKIRSEALIDVRDKMTGIMRNMTMIIGFYMRGPVGSPGSNPAMEITSSLYVSHSAELLYRNAFFDFDKEVERLGHYYTNIHSEGLNRLEDCT